MSPMYIAENFGESWLDIQLPFPCEIHNCFPRRLPDKTHFSVLLHYTEPRALKCPIESVRDIAPVFDLILTNEESLTDLPNARLALFGGCWVSDGPPPQKRFEISFLYSNGCGLEDALAGYRLRRRIWMAMDGIRAPKAFYTSSRRPPRDIGDPNPYPHLSKDALFGSMFSIIIENDSQDNYFTEKIIDAFRTHTVPIYYGAPNIGKYFDTSGIIKIEDEAQLIGILNSLTPDDYWIRSAAMNHNFSEAEKYMDLTGNLKKLILHHHGETAAP